MPKTLELMVDVTAARDLERETWRSCPTHDLDSEEYRVWRKRWLAADNKTIEARRNLSVAIKEFCPVAVLDSRWLG